MRSITHSMDRTSPAEPRAMYKNDRSSYRRAALKSLGDIVGDRNGCALNLIAQGAIAPQRSALSQREHSHGQIGCSLPNGKLLESFVLHGKHSGINRTTKIR